MKEERATANWKQKAKEQLDGKKAKGLEFAVWKLNSEQKAYVRALGYEVEPYMYEITTRTFYNVRGLKYQILEDIHYDKKSGKKHSVRTLTPEEIEVLEEFEVQYRILKYKIKLCEKI